MSTSPTVMVTEASKRTWESLEGTLSHWTWLPSESSANDGTVAILDPGTGDQRATYERDVMVWTKPTVGDVDGDGAAEVFVRYGDGRVVRLDGGLS